MKNPNNMKNHKIPKVTPSRRFQIHITNKNIPVLISNIARVFVDEEDFANNARNRIIGVSIALSLFCCSVFSVVTMFSCIPLRPSDHR